jgi:Uma2 family endonuclease
MAALPEDGWLYELVGGHLVRMPPPNRRHGFLELEIGAMLRAHVKPCQLGRVYVGEAGFNLTLPGEPVETVLGADVAFVRADRLLPDDANDSYGIGAPDLAVEIASPSQFRPEMGAKAWLWLQRGTRLVWIVWPARRQVDVWTPDHDEPHTLNSGDTLDGAEVLPGFTYPLIDLFTG